MMSPGSQRSLVTQSLSAIHIYIDSKLRIQSVVIVTVNFGKETFQWKDAKKE